MSQNAKTHNVRETKTELPSRVAQWYYKHGLFLSSYPTCVSSLAIFMVLLSWYVSISPSSKEIFFYWSWVLTCVGGFRNCFSYPLLHIPLPGTIPTKIILPYESQTDSIKSSWIPSSAPADGIDANKFENISLEHPPFPWANNEPFVYIQQIVLRSSVMPWQSNLWLTDAYRGPLHEIFKLLEIVRNHEDETR